jgi:hypothetical protein
MRIFLAGIMQGSHRTANLHEQDYRGRIKNLLAEYLQDAKVYDPLADHADSLEYGEERGREVFWKHNRMCREVDAVVAYVPEASMGTAIEMWEAYEAGRAVIAISPLAHNWAILFLSHALYADLDAFAAALASGEIAKIIEGVSN